MQPIKNRLLDGLESSLDKVGVSLEQAQQIQLIEYLLLIEKWNAVHNLTAVRDPFLMIDRHIIDSLSLRSYLPVNGKIADVGSGAGLPGIPLAIVEPNCEFVLIESREKKCLFMEQAVMALGLNRVVVVQTRVEQYQPSIPFDLVISRAFSSLSNFVKLSRHLCKKDGKLIGMKAAWDPKEGAELPVNCFIEKIQAVQSTGSAERNLVFVRCT